MTERNLKKQSQFGVCSGAEKKPRVETQGLNIKKQLSRQRKA